MKFNKALLAAPLASIMTMGAMTVPTFAAETITGGSVPTTATANVNYEVAQSYEWRIHTDIDFGANQGINRKDVDGKATDGDNTVSVTKNVIAEGSHLDITVAGSGEEGAFQVKNGSSGSEILGYTVNNGTDNIQPDGVVMSVPAGTNSDSKTMKFTLSTTTKAAEVAGHYDGTLTYTATINK